MKQVKDLKEKQATELADAVSKEAKALLDTEEVKALESQIKEFLSDPYNGNYYLDDYGMLNSYIDLDLGTLANAELEVIDEVLESLSDGIGHFEQDQYSQGPRDCQYHQCLGEPVIYNESPERGHYAIYSTELSLKVDSVPSEEHGFLIIEQAMRRHGVFDNVVATDYHGLPTLLEVPEKIRLATDSELQSMLDDIGNQ